jgi:hypothetical protein
MEPKITRGPTTTKAQRKYLLIRPKPRIRGTDIKQKIKNSFLIDDHP